MPGRKRLADAEDETQGGLTHASPPTQRRRLSASPASDDYEGPSTQTVSNLDELVKKFVRLALACEYQRRPLRRQDIGEKVLGSAGRQFKQVFAQAQLELRSVFGMEMVELPAREKVTVAQKRAAQQKADKQKPQTTAWILTSILPTDFHDPAILPPSAIPTSEEDSKYTAIYTLLVSLIALSGGSLPEAKVERYLRRMQMEDSTPIDGSEKTEKLFKRMEREGYVVKIKESIGAGGEEEVSWTVGPRGKMEIGDAGVKGLTSAVYGELDEAAQDELDRKIARSLGIGERPVERAKEKQANIQTAEKKKRGRPRKQQESEDEDGDNGEEEEDEY